VAGEPQEKAAILDRYSTTVNFESVPACRFVRSALAFTHSLIVFTKTLLASPFFPAPPLPRSRPHDGAPGFASRPLDVNLGDHTSRRRLGARWPIQAVFLLGWGAACSNP
jgi:hypothetical protein